MLYISNLIVKIHFYVEAKGKSFERDATPQDLFDFETIQQNSLYILSIFFLCTYINLHMLAEARAFKRKPALAHPLPMEARSMARGLQPPACEHVGQALRSQLARICEGAACTMQVAVSRSEAMGNYSGD